MFLLALLAMPALLVLLVIAALVAGLCAITARARRSRHSPYAHHYMPAEPSWGVDAGGRTWVQLAGTPFMPGPTVVWTPQKQSPAPVAQLPHQRRQLSHRGEAGTRHCTPGQR